MNPAAVAIPLFVAAIAFEVFCLADLARAEEVRRLPRGAWAIICLVSIPLGGIIYLVAGRVPTGREYQRGYRAAQATVSRAADAVWAGLDDVVDPDFDLHRWARSRKAALGAAAAGGPGARPGFTLPDWFPPLADDLGSLLDPVGFDRWSFTPSDAFVRGYQAALRDAWDAGRRATVRA